MFSVIRRTIPAARAITARRAAAPMFSQQTRAFAVGAKTDGDYIGVGPEPIENMSYHTQEFSTYWIVFAGATFLCSISYLMPLWMIPFNWSRHNKVQELGKKYGPTVYGRNHHVFY